MSAPVRPDSRPRWVRTAIRLTAEWAGFAALLFVTRFVARGHLVPLTDQECFIGGIATDVLAHGVRFPLLAYAPNEYDNGSFFSGLLAAVSFAVFGRSVLALKLVTHAIVAAGAVAALWLLRGCLDEAGLSRRRERWPAIAVLVVAIAVAPRVVTLCSVYAVGNHAEGSAIVSILLALFSRRWHAGSAPRTAALWALVGVALYLNKATLLAIPLLALAELVLAPPTARRLGAAAGGFAAGLLPELLVILRGRGMGWMTMAGKAGRYSAQFPQAFVDDLLTLGEFRVELLALWVIAVAAGAVSLVQAARRATATLPIALTLTVGFTVLHLAALTVMAQGGLDAYAIYGYPTLSVLVAVLVAAMIRATAARYGAIAAAWAGAVAVALTVVAYRPDAITWGLVTTRALAANRAGAACSWRFAEGFMRERDYGVAPASDTREQYAITRCRTLSEAAQVLDCIGGIARELNWRHDGHVDGAPPPGLSAAEGRAYAYHYGTHRNGDALPCADFADPALVAECAAATRLECLGFADMLTRFASGHGLRRPTCELAEPPMTGFWSSLRRDLLTRRDGTPPILEASGDTGVRKCQPTFDACYGAAGAASP